MFIPSECDIGILCTNMRIEANNASYDMELQNQDFETPGERHDETPGERHDIGFLCSNMRIEGNKSRYDMEFKNHDLETKTERHEQKSKFEEGVHKSLSMNENVHRWLV